MIFSGTTFFLNAEITGFWEGQGIFPATKAKSLGYMFPLGPLKRGQPPEHPPFR